MKQGIGRNVYDVIFRNNIMHAQWFYIIDCIVYLL